jgi:EmrB/QacA subfamily drug resistance transporter
MPDDPSAIEGQAFTHREIRHKLSGVLLGMLLAGFDQTIVVTALPAMSSELHGLQHLSWIVTAYLLTSTASTPIYGKISDLYGRPRLYELAIFIFIAASIFCALAQSMAQLIVARALQGIGGGGLVAIAQAIIADAIAPRERGRYQAYLTGVWAVASIGGPVLGGLFVEFLTWRWAFWINLPLGLVAIFVCRGALKRLHFRRAIRRIDYVGAALLVPAVTVLLLITAWGGTEYPWFSPEILGLAALGLVLIATFILQELAAAEPIIPPRLFANPIIRLNALISLCISMAMFGGIVLLPVFLQLVSKVSAGNSGFLLIPFMGSSMLSSYFAGQALRKNGRYKPSAVFGQATAVVGYLLLMLMTAATPAWLSSIYMFVLGIGIGCVMPMMMISTQNAADPGDIGVATATVSFFRSLGGAFGAAILWSMLLYGFTRQLGGTNVANAGALLRGTGQGMPSLDAATTTALAASFVWVFLVGAGISAVGLGLTLRLKEIPLRAMPARIARGEKS